MEVKMSRYIIYFLVIILANTVGAISGMGGGVIIKPVFDSIGFHTLSAITFYSSVAVFTMSISSTFKQIKNGIKVRWFEAGFVSLGSIMGGILGNRLFVYLQGFYNSDKVQLIQIVLTIISLILVLIYTLSSKKMLNLSGWLSYLMIGLFLGSFSTFLGIGGGPINVSLLIFCFGLTMKDATVYSIITIFFSQLAKLVEIGLSEGYQAYDLTFLWVIIPAAILGGYIGGVVSGKVSDKYVAKIFVGVVLLVIFINFYNGVVLIK